LQPPGDQETLERLQKRLMNQPGARRVPPPERGLCIRADGVTGTAGGSTGSWARDRAHSQRSPTDRGSFFSRGLVITCNPGAWWNPDQRQNKNMTGVLYNTR